MKHREKYQVIAFIQKYATVLYLVVYSSVICLFFKLRLYKLEYYPLDSYITKHKIRQFGLVRLRGNLGAIHEWWIIVLLIMGVSLGLIIFLYTGTRLKQPSAASLLLSVGALIPLLPPYNENVLARLAVGTFLVFFGALGQWFFNSSLSVKKSVYLKENSFFNSPTH